MHLVQNICGKSLRSMATFLDHLKYLRRMTPEPVKNKSGKEFTVGHKPFHILIESDFSSS